jgi:hypothetical protein
MSVAINGDCPSARGSAGRDAGAKRKERTDSESAGSRCGFIVFRRQHGSGATHGLERACSLPFPHFMPLARSGKCPSHDRFGRALPGMVCTAHPATRSRMVHHRGTEFTEMEANLNIYKGLYSVLLASFAVESCPNLGASVLICG